MSARVERACGDEHRPGSPALWCRWTALLEKWTAAAIDG